MLIELRGNLKRSISLVLCTASLLYLSGSWNVLAKAFLLSDNRYDEGLLLWELDEILNTVYQATTVSEALKFILVKHWA